VAKDHKEEPKAPRKPKKSKKKTAPRRKPRKEPKAPESPKAKDGAATPAEKGTKPAYLLIEEAFWQWHKLILSKQPPGRETTPGGAEGAPPGGNE
jgi:hypothetical protein